MKKSNMPTRKQLKHKDNLLSVRTFWDSGFKGYNGKTYRKGSL